MNVKTYLSQTLSSLYVGLKNNWLTTREVVSMINENSNNLIVDQQALLDIYVYGGDRIRLLNILESQSDIKELDGINAWQLAHLIAIEQSDFSIHDKLIEIELLWSKFDYPESWQDFIYYMPNEKVNTEEGIYHNFLAFIHSQKTT